MNYKMVFNILGRVMLLEATFLILPIIVNFIYLENNLLCYLIPIFILLIVGIPAITLKPKDKSIYAKEGFLIVSFAWIILSLVGAIPFILTGATTSYVDALFETISGFTTTGASVINDVEILPKSLLFWRSFTNFIGGMGVLVFVLAIMPSYNQGDMHVFRAESPGPSVGKFVSKIKNTSRILYSIYIVMTLILFVLLCLGGMPVFDSITHAFSTAGTGGFSIKNTSIQFYNSVYIEMVIAVFMFLFGINFNFYYLLLFRKFSKAFKSEELKTYLIIVLSSTLLIALSLLNSLNNFGEALRYAFFQTASISSTTGFTSANFNAWPIFAQGILTFLMITGSCAGSTSGGIKISRLSILFKSSIVDVKKTSNPRRVLPVKYDGEVVEKDVVNNVKTYLGLWFFIVIISTLLISIENYGDLITNLSASLTCISNVGPGFGLVGPIHNFYNYSYFSKLVLSFTMLAGRLELFPMLILFQTATWKKR